MELKEAIEKCEKAVKVLTGNDTGIRLDFEGTASAIDTVLEELNNRIPRKDIEDNLKKTMNILEEKYSAEKISVFSGNTYMEKFKLLGKTEAYKEILNKE